ncbi:tryptophan--tRNA ligase [Candidatus Woesearchaeota archaeon]|jgi:tryptophanyl-tRNA synthetase|nr:MAG: tryptophan--tRNA ligase [Candidatus Woesearchaeota archaeon]
MSDQIITPWEVKGNIDYDKIIKEFGVSPISEDLLKRIEKKAGTLHHFLRRKIFFAHRDLNVILDDYEKGKPFFLYTGRAPSGPLHLGHLVPLLFTKWLQETFDVELYIQFPDEEKFLMKNNLSWEDAQKYLEENMIDIAAMGFNPKRTHFLIDTKHANLMYPEAIKVAKKLTFNQVKGAFGFDDSQNIGAIFYTSMQAVPAFLPSVLKKQKLNCLVPLAIDQEPHFRLARDVIPKLGYPKPATIGCRFLPGLGGMIEDGKMSASAEHTAVYTTDDPKTVKKKINKYAFSGGQATVEEHREKGGNPDIDVAYQWLTFFEEDDQKLKEIYQDYKEGKLLSGEIKALCIDKVNEFLGEHQKRREQAKKDLDKFILKA